MKKILLLIFILCFKLNYGQNGFKLIRESENLIAKNEYKKALKLLAKAEKEDYGFCGNVWVEVRAQINILKSEIFINQKDYDKALSILDSVSGCSYGADCAKSDSLKVKTLILKFGLEKVKQEFNKNTTPINLIYNDLEDFHSVYFSEFNYKLRFYFTDIYQINKKETLESSPDYKKEIPFNELIKYLNFYTLLN